MWNRSDRDVNVSNQAPGAYTVILIPVANANTITVTGRPSRLDLSVE